MDRGRIVSTVKELSGDAKCPLIESRIEQHFGTVFQICNPCQTAELAGSTPRTCLGNGARVRHATSDICAYAQIRLVSAILQSAESSCIQAIESFFVLSDLALTKNPSRAPIEVIG